MGADLWTPLIVTLVGALLWALAEGSHNLFVGFRVGYTWPRRGSGGRYGRAGMAFTLIGAAGLLVQHLV